MDGIGELYRIVMNCDSGGTKTAYGFQLTTWWCVGWYIIQSGSFEVCVDDRAVRQLRSKHSFGELAMLYSVLPGIRG